MAEIRNVLAVDRQKEGRIGRECFKVGADQAQDGGKIDGANLHCFLAIMLACWFYAGWLGLESAIYKAQI